MFVALPPAHQSLAFDPSVLESMDAVLQVIELRRVLEGEIAVADPAKRQEILANGISEAMNATALGLVTAIFAMVMHSILANRAQKIIEESCLVSILRRRGAPIPTRCD